MLKEITHIEGLEGYDNIDLIDDTDPGATHVRFEVRSEEMPFLTGESTTGIVRKNFVWIFKEMNLGNAKLERRIRDKVEFVDGKWRVTKLAVHSDIKRYPEIWNAFARGAKEDITGTPVLLLFRNDPSRAEFYKFHHILTVEQLSRLGQTETETIGMGAMDDVKRAKLYLERIKRNASDTLIDTKLEEKNKEVASLQAQLKELTGVVSELVDKKEVKEKVKVKEI